MLYLVLERMLYQAHVNELVCSIELTCESFMESIQATEKDANETGFACKTPADINTGSDTRRKDDVETRFST